MNYAKLKMLLATEPYAAMSDEAAAAALNAETVAKRRPTMSRSCWTGGAAPRWCRRGGGNGWTRPGPETAGPGRLLKR